ncbi:MAG TPA: hypothetical protein VFY90_10135, partial [Tepidiformaceae bacterium]|nr:hypothetical protein [Tepidiformaceae bacterium]
GFDVDLSLTCTTGDMIYVVRGDLSLPDATAAGRLEILGSRKLARALWAWLNLSPLASVVSQRDREAAMVAAGG